MSVGLLDAWGSVEYDFLCRQCGFKDSKYDAVAALSRFVGLAHSILVGLSQMANGRLRSSGPTEGRLYIFDYL